MNKVPKTFFLKNDVVQIAKSLIGFSLFSQIDGQICGGIITETEAYQGVTDKACHAYGGRITKRNQTMYQKGGVTYVYLCYGIHAMLNFVTNDENIPDAVLIRSFIPTHGEELILKRTGKNRITPDITSGPGKVTKALGITTCMDNIPLDGNTIWVENRNLLINPTDITITPRIGIDYAEEDAKRPYRFLLKNNYYE